MNLRSFERVPQRIQIDSSFGGFVLPQLFSLPNLVRNLISYILKYLDRLPLMYEKYSSVSISTEQNFIPLRGLSQRQMWHAKPASTAILTSSRLKDSQDGEASIGSSGTETPGNSWPQAILPEQAFWRTDTEKEEELRTSGECLYPFFSTQK